MLSQSCRSGREYHNVSILQVTERCGVGARECIILWMSKYAWAALWDHMYQKEFYSKGAYRTCQLPSKDEMYLLYYHFQSILNLATPERLFFQ
jgi:hypothetical protein